MKVLIVDDEESIRDLLTSVVSRMGHSTVTVDNPVTAMERFQGGEFDLVVTDFLMGPYDGMTFAIKIRGLDKQVPILMVTGTDGVAMFNAQMGYPVQQILMKPFRLHQLEESILHLTNRRAHGASN